MSSETKFKCDECGKRIEGPPLQITMSVELVMFSGDLCCEKCAHSWLSKKILAL